MDTIYLLYTPDERTEFERTEYVSDQQAMEASRGMASPHRIIKVIDYKNNPETVEMNFLDPVVDLKETNLPYPQHEQIQGPTPVKIKVEDSNIGEYYMHDGKYKKLIEITYNGVHPNPAYKLRFEDGRLESKQPGEILLLYPRIYGDKLRLRPSQSAGKRVSRSKRKTPLNKRTRKTRDGSIKASKGVE